jgi:hypothetical protein
MQAIDTVDHTSFPEPRRPRSRSACAPRANRTIAPASLTPIAPASCQSLPKLKGIPRAYNCQPNRTLIYRLCSLLVTHGMADVARWKETEASPLAFAAKSLAQHFDRLLGAVVNDNVDFALEIQDFIDGYSRSVLESGRLVALVDTRSAGVLIFGSALDLLEETRAGLGSAFYSLLLASINRWIGVYDHGDAQLYENSLRDMAEQEEPDNIGAYEFPNVGEALPSCLQGPREWTEREARILLRSTQNSPCKEWIDRLLRINRLSHLRVSRLNIDRDYDYPPLPSLLIIFHRNDAVEASFEAEAQYMYEVSHEPTFAATFHLDDMDECRGIMRSLAAFCLLNRELFELVDILNTLEERHGHRDQHPTGSPLPAD